MTMPVYPFPLVRPAGYTSGDVPTPAELQALQEEAAAAADGRIWTDIAVVKNWAYTQVGSISTMVQKSLLRDPVSRRWFVFGGNTASASFSADGSRWFNTGTVGFGDLAPAMTAVQSAAVNSAGIILAGGAPTSASTGKIRESADGGATWSTVRNIGASNTNSVHSLAYSETLALWFCGVANEGLFSSPDRVTWTVRTAGVPLYMCIRESPSPILIGSPIVGAANTSYRRSVDGITWTTETFPENLSSQAGCWNAVQGKFFFSGATGVWSSTTGLTGSWTQVNATTGQSSIASFGRMLVRGDGKASIDGGVTWFRVLELNGQTDLHVTATPYGVGMVRGATFDVYLSAQVGF